MRVCHGCGRRWAWVKGPGNNPYCHYRARTLAGRGPRERLVRAQRAPGQPFDCGLFDIVEEPLDTPESTPEKPEHRLRVV